MENTKPPQSDRHHGAIITLGLICAGLLAYGIFGSENRIINVGYLVGYNLPLTLIIWGIYCAILGRKRRRGICLASLVIIFTCLMLSSLIGYAKQKHLYESQKQEAREAMSDIQDQFSDLASQSTTLNGLPRKVNVSKQPVSRASGEVGEIEYYMKNYIKELAEQRNSYMTEVEAIGWSTILSPNRIHSDTSFKESMSIIANAKLIVEKYRLKTDSILNDTRAQIATLNVSSIIKSDMRSGFDHGMETVGGQIQEMWRMEMAVVEEAEKMILLLSNNRDDWSVNSGQLNFHSKPKLAAYMDHLKTIQELVQKQQQIQQQSFQAVNENLNSVQSALE